MKAEPLVVEAFGRQLKVTNLDKVLYPASGFTKGDVMAWYRDIAETIVPHLTGRPITLVRLPDGIGKQRFFEKNCNKSHPAWLETLPLYAPSAKRTVRYCLFEEPAALIWSANLAALELHPTLSTRPDLASPSYVVFDLDPGAPAGLVECCAVALLIRDELAADGLRAWPKVSGGKGLQLYAPVGGATFEDTRSFALRIAEKLEADHGDLVVKDMSKDIRPGRVFLDWSRNNPGSTMVAVYSLRGRDQPWVSAPVTWEEVEAARTEDDLRFDPDAVRARVAEHGDLFGPVLTELQALPRSEGV